MNDRQNVPSRHLISLRQRFVWLLSGVVGMFAAGMALSLVFSLHSNKIADARLLNVEASQAQANIMRRWDYYREFADNLARDPQLIQLMQSGSAVDRQRWAMSHGRLVPDLMGLLLIDPQGRGYGDVGLLHARSGHQVDGVRRVPDSNGSVRVQRNRAGEEYIDFEADVRGPGDALLGKVLVSMHLARLQRVIDDSTQPGHAILLFDAADTLVVSHGALKGAVHTISVPLPDMGWKLIVRSPVPGLSGNDLLQILAGVLTLTGVLILLVMVVYRMRKPVQQEIDGALNALACLTRNETAPDIETRYAEFAPAAAAINRIAQQLHSQREKLAALSLTDVLTGLPNRRAFETQFPHMLGLADRGHAIALVLLDVDHFKAINDQLGHAAGDQALIALAHTLMALTRSADMTARLAGDEFTVLLSGLDAAGVQAWYQRLADRFRSELRAAGLTVDNTLSAGQTWLQGMAGDSVGKALARADDALYQAKEHGRGQLVLAEAASEKNAE
jgi:diguanylate cyclase (GGDEF)-like protein